MNQKKIYLFISIFFLTSIKTNTMNRNNIIQSYDSTGETILKEERTKTKVRRIKPTIINGKLYNYLALCQGKNHINKPQKKIITLNESIKKKEQCLEDLIKVNNKKNNSQLTEIIKNIKGFISDLKIAQNLEETAKVNMYLELIHSSFTSAETIINNNSTSLNQFNINQEQQPTLEYVVKTNKNNIQDLETIAKNTNHTKLLAITENLKLFMSALRRSIHEKNKNNIECFLESIATGMNEAKKIMKKEGIKMIGE